MKCVRVILCSALLLLVSFAGWGQLTASPQTFFLLIDTSSSMSEVPKKPKVPEDWKFSKMAEVKRQLTNFLAGLPTETAIKAFVFDQTIRPGPQCEVLDAEQREKLTSYFGNLRAVGAQTFAWRSLDYVLEKAHLAVAVGSPGITVKVLIFTDGEDNDPARPDLSAILAKYSDDLKDRIEASYITLGFTLSSDLVRVLKESQVQVRAAYKPAEIIPLNAAFSWAPLRPTAEEDEVEFADQTQGSARTINWSFGDGATSNEKSPKHLFRTPGPKIIQLVVTDERGRSNSITKTLVVSPRIPLEARFTNTPPNEVPAGDWVQFVNQSKGPFTSLQWFFGDGTSSADEHPAHKFGLAGFYAVTLTVADGRGGRQSITNALRVLGPPPPKAQFQPLGEIAANAAAQFIDRSVGTIEQRVWEFGDGTPPVKERDPQHIFRVPGDFTVRLTCIGPGGRSSSAASIHVASPPPPVAAFELGVAKPRVGDEIKLLDTSAGSVERALWSFSDSGSAFEIAYNDHTSRSISHRFGAVGSNTITLQVWGQGGQDKKQIVLNVASTNLPPQAICQPDRSKGRGTLRVHFANKSSGTVRRCAWNFGDGSPELTQESIADVEHAFGPGVYAVTLTVFGMDEFGPSRYTSQPITVNRPFPPFVRHLPWAAPSAIAMICLAPIAVKRASRRRMLRELSSLTGIVKCGLAGSPPSQWKKHVVDGLGSEFSFRPLDSFPPGATGEAYGRLLSLSIKKIVDPTTLEESYTLAVAAEKETIETQSIRPDEDVFLQTAPYALRYEP